MATKPNLIRAIPKTKIKAFDYNYNFDQFQSYVDEVIGDVSGSMPVGAIYQAIRTDVPANSLRLDGREYTSGFDNFILNYLISGKIITKSYVEWQEEYDNNGGNVGFFAYDADTGKFKVPCIQAGTFLAQAVASGEFGSFLNSEIKSHNHIQDSHAHTRGTMEITGNMYGAALAADGAFYPTGEYGAGSGDYNPQNIGFQASRTWTGATSAAQPHIYPTGGDDTYPKHIKYPFFVVVSNVEAESPSQIVWDNFVGNLDSIVGNLDSKANTDLSNCTKPYVTQSYVNGASWYRKWSNGYCEQGGCWSYTHDARYKSAVQTLLVPLQSVTFQSAASANHSGTSTAVSGIDFSATTITGTKTQITVWCERLINTSTSTAGKVYWQINGYI